MTRRQWMKAYADALQLRGLWTRQEANRSAEHAVEHYWHHAPERVALVAVHPFDAPRQRDQQAEGEVGR